MVITDAALLLVFQRLPLQSRGVAATVSKAWHRVAQHPDLWRNLALSNCKTPQKYLRLIPAVPGLKEALREVSLEFATGVENKDLELLRGCNLEVLNVNACQRLTDSGIAGLVQHLPGLTSISLYWNLNVTDLVLFALAAHCLRLTRLNLSGCKRVTDDGVRTVAKCCPGLTHVDLTRCLEVTDAGYTSLAKHCPQLQELRMYACSGITDVSVRAFGSLHRLQLIDLCGAALITDVALEALANCHQLVSVNLTWCIQLTGTGVVLLAAGCPQLEWLSLHGIRRIDDAAIAALSKHCAGKLHTLDVNGCVSVTKRDKASLQALFPKLTCFTVHT